MKKLFFIFAVVLSTVVNAQINSEINSTDSVQNSFKFKTGDHDALLVNGLLKYFISDSAVKYMYSRFSPNIGKLKVTSHDNIINSYDNWIKQDFSIYNSNMYYVRYIGSNSKINNNAENLYIYDTHTNNIIRVITIWYSDIDPLTGLYTNVISVNDVTN
jgi:hypothetical protein